jgi:hypothetical protein
VILRDGLANTDIPRRDKMRESVISQWRISFEQLKSDLSVSIENFLSALLTFSAIEILRARQFHCGLLVQLESRIVFGVNRPLDLM